MMLKITRVVLSKERITIQLDGRLSINGSSYYASPLSWHWKKESSSP